MTASVSFLGDNLGDNLGDVLGDFSPVTTLLTWADGTFANASSRHIWDEAGEVMYGVFAGGTAAIANIDDKNWLQMEGARENSPPDAVSAWTLRGLVESTAGQSDPAGGTSAYLLENLGAKGVDDCFSTSVPSHDLGATISPSVLMKKSSGTGPVFIANGESAIYGVWEIDLSLLGSDWERITEQHPAVTVTTAFTNSSVNGRMRVQMYGTSGEDVFIWQPQVDQAVFASSPIPETVTRAADAMSFSSGDVPDTIRSGKWTAELTTMCADTDFATSDRKYLYYLDASNYLALNEDGAGSVKVKLLSGGGGIVSTVTFSRDQTVSITVDFIAGELTTAGFTTGDGTTSGTVTPWPSSTLYVGSDSVPDKHLFGRLAEPVPA